MAKEKRTFVFNIDWAEVLAGYPADVRLEVYDAIIRYVATGTPPELKPLSGMAFSFIRNEIDRNSSRYEQTVSKRSEAGRKGMSSRYDKGDEGDCGTADAFCGYRTDSAGGARDPASPPPGNLDGEIEALKTEDTWLEGLQMLHHMDKGQLLGRLDEFKAQCVADGRDSHQSLQDAKRHFNSWLRIAIEKNSKNSKNNDDTGSKGRGQRGAGFLDPDAKKDYGGAF